MTIVRESNVSFNRWPDFIKAVKQVVGTGAYEHLANIHGFPHTDDDGFKYAKHRMCGMAYGPIRL